MGNNVPIYGVYLGGYSTAQPLAPITSGKKATSMYRTQKARSLDAGWTLSREAGYGYNVAAVHGVWPHLGNEGAKNFFKGRKGGPPLFARPCPVTPRHGFVESRSVKTYADFKRVIAETLAQDAQGEVILMDRLTGRYSAVMTATGVAWGRKNDGVTSGKGEQRLIPTPAGRFDQLFYSALGLEKTANHGVYCELVEHDGRIVVVQMRLGPKQPDSRLTRILRGSSQVITSVLTADTEDLIEWDKILGRHIDNLYKAVESTLVWLPGQSLSSHFVVQALSHGYAVSVEETCPIGEMNIEGERLLQLAETPSDLGEDQYKELARYLDAERTTTFWDFPRDVLLSVATLHALPYWDGKPWLLRLRARGVMIAARYGLSACLGESRHLLRNLTPNNPRKAQVPWKSLLGYNPREHDGRPSRPYVFVRSLIVPWADCASLALNAADDLWIEGQGRVMEWLKTPGNSLLNYKSSYRGHRWEWAALRVHDLICAIDKFIEAPTALNWGVVLGHYNEIINAAHNGGYLLNKWASANLIDNAAQNPALAFGFRQVMRVVWSEKDDGRALAWLPMTLMKSTEDYVAFKGAFIHKTLYTTLLKQQVIDGDGKVAGCNCSSCLERVWSPIGMLASAMGYPVYVPVNMLPSMPYFDESVEVQANDPICENGSGEMPPGEDDDDIEEDDSGSTVSEI